MRCYRLGPLRLRIWADRGDDLWLLAGPARDLSGRRDGILAGLGTRRVAVRWR